ncbi:hypothetical protein BKP35_00690 [Anaerobacillus arseniciselenatis]|uniref:SIMPL domain-containing protein n=1 Tax=Anaerobacillus arseniciselenatis TaxID=85682 RepID=A0A1S2LT94_9BACI|nr:SIMPL domain-containing protein [Anaerobacillus arseniciselenatis]OIJ15544.1 hypothetical protein BKP35_00690 [Anaerobacillus arseniciselenatis]
MYHAKVNCLKVSGEGTISVSPNQAKIKVGVMTEHESLQQAQQENTKIISDVINALINLGVPNENIQTVTYRIEPLYDYENGRQIFRGYRVTHQLQIKIEDVDLVGQIVDLAVSQGANTISNIQFTVSQPEFHYNEALRIALNDAYMKAYTLTTQLNVNLNPIPIKLDEYSQISSPPVPFTQTFMAQAEATPIQPGEIKISATVIAQYTYC